MSQSERKKMKSVVLLSGGVDSTLALALQIANGNEPHTLTVHYGQRHDREIQAAWDVAEYYGVSNTVADVRGGIFGGSALTDDVKVPDGHADRPDETFVPGRNTVLLALATAYAESIGAGLVVIGANADDAAGYPDCRRKFLDSFRDTISLGTAGKVWLHAPLLSATKAEIIAEAKRLGVPVDLTWSCYRGGDTACGTCGACVSRIEAERANVPSQ